MSDTLVWLCGAMGIFGLPIAIWLSQKNLLIIFLSGLLLPTTGLFIFGLINHKEVPISKLIEPLKEPLYIVIGMIAPAFGALFLALLGRFGREKAATESKDK